MRDKLKLYKYHVANIKSIEIALEHTSRLTHNSISLSNEKEIQSFVRLYALLLGIWAENRLQKLILEKDCFDDLQIKNIKNKRTEYDSWTETIKIAFIKQYKVKRINSLEFTELSKYNELMKLIDKHLKPIIEIRNKLAHGQWIYPLNNDCTDVEKEKFTMINKENVLSLQFKKSLLKYITDLVNDLVVSRSTFERDFNKHYSLIKGTFINLEKRKYSDYKKKLEDKKTKGKLLRKQGTIGI